MRTTLSKNGGDVSISTTNNDIVSALSELTDALEPKAIGDIVGLQDALNKKAEISIDGISDLLNKAIALPEGTIVRTKDRQEYVAASLAQTNADLTAVSGQGFFVKAFRKGVYLLSAFGVVGTAIGASAYDETDIIQKAIDKATSEGATIETGLKKRDLHVSRLFVSNGLKALNLKAGRCRLLGTGQTTGEKLTDAVLILDGPKRAEELTAAGDTVPNRTSSLLKPVADCEISVEMDMSAGDRMAIVGKGCEYVDFGKSRIYGFTLHETLHHRGVRLDSSSSYNDLGKIYIEGFDYSPAEYRQHATKGLLVDIWGEGAAYGGYSSNSYVRATNPAKCNKINGATLIGGSYAFNLHNCEYSKLEGIHAENQNHRNGYFGNCSAFNEILGGTFIDGLSASIMFTYGACYNSVSDVICRSTGMYEAGGESAINIQTGSRSNVITNARIYTTHKYGIYIATGASGTVIDGGFIENSFQAFIAIENDWRQGMPATAAGSRTNYGPPDGTVLTSWCYGDLEGVTVKNVIFGKGGRAQTIGIYCAQVHGIAEQPEYGLKNISIKNAIFTTTENVNAWFWFYYENVEKVSGIKVEGLSLPDGAITGTNKFLCRHNLNVGSFNDVLSSVKNSDYLEHAVERNFAPMPAETRDITEGENTVTLSTTSARHWSCGFLPANHPIDYIDGMIENKEYTFRGNNGEIRNDTNRIRLNGLVSRTLNANQFIKLQRVGSFIYEVG